MTLISVLAFLLVLAPLEGEGPDSALVSAPEARRDEGARGHVPGRMPQAEWTQLTIEQRIIIRVPMVRPGRNGERVRRGFAFDDETNDIEWEEHKGPKCVPIRALAAASITTKRGVDLFMKDHSRMRARLGRECRPADLYSGFYIQPTTDGTLCAGRDQLLARNGTSCDIDSFRRLVPERP